jgi:hypothetical protein
MQIKNNVAIAYWTIVSLFMGVIVAMTHVFFRDGPPTGHSAPFMVAVLALFWAFGLGAVGHAFSKPRVHARIEHARITVTLRYPVKTLRFVYGYDQVRHAGIVESRDSEGDPHFTVQVSMKDGRNFDLKEGSLEVCERVLSQFENALRGHSKDSLQG